MIRLCEECRDAGHEGAVRLTIVRNPDTLLVTTQAWLCEACREAYREEEADVQVLQVRGPSWRPRWAMHREGHWCSP